jgi:hypothetical protein
MGMGLVVRCPECRETAETDWEARGRTVQCPRCERQFIAVPEAELVAPGRSSRNPTLPTFPSSPAKQELPQLPRIDQPASSFEHDHDPKHRFYGPLPASVLIALALLPFGIPIIWLIAPVLLGQPPLLSIAVPFAIAISASILSLAVIYTIDWSPSVRIKGVVMLLALAYFASVSLYFMKEGTVSWFRLHFGRWDRFVYNNEYSVWLPQPLKHEKDDQPIPDIKLTCHTLSHEDVEMGRVTYVIGDGPPGEKGRNPDPGSDPWFEATGQNIIAASRGTPIDLHQLSQRVPNSSGYDCREFVIDLGGNRTRIVRLFFIRNKVYYLSVEGNALTAENDFAREFFNSFTVDDFKKR